MTLSAGTPGESLGALRILLAHHDPAALAVLVSALASTPHEVLATGDPRRVSTICDEESVRLVIVTADHPHSGPLLARLRVTHPDVARILVTRSLAPDGETMITEPIDPRELRRLVVKELARLREACLISGARSTRPSLSGVRSPRPVVPETERRVERTNPLDPTNRHTLDDARLEELLAACESPTLRPFALAWRARAPRRTPLVRRVLVLTALTVATAGTFALLGRRGEVRGAPVVQPSTEPSSEPSEPSTEPSTAPSMPPSVAPAPRLDEPPAAPPRWPAIISMIVVPRIITPTPPLPVACRASITSTPSGAAIRWGTVRLGRTPLRAVAVPCGRAIVVAENASGRARRKVTAFLGETTVALRLSPRATVYLSFTSQPPGATFVVDGQRVGRAPAMLPVKAFSKVEVRASLPFHRGWTRTLNVKGRSIAVHVKLESQLTSRKRQ